MLNIFSIMLGEEDNIGYTGYIVHTAPRHSVPNHHTAAEKKRDRSMRSWSNKCAELTTQETRVQSVPGTSCSCRQSSGHVRLSLQLQQPPQQPPQPPNHRPCAVFWRQVLES